MNKIKHKFVLCQSSENIYPSEYLGSDNLPITDSYQMYLQKSAEFLSKAEKFKQNNLKTKNSLLHQNKYGYINSEDFEEKVLLERNGQMEHFKKIYSSASFVEDVNCMYKNVKGKGKRIRIIREIKMPKVPEFSENFEKETKFWFTRYCTLSKFIQAARLVIIINRLTKVLRKLNLLNPAYLEKNTEGIHKDGIDQREETENESFKEKHSRANNDIIPCNY